MNKIQSDFCREIEMHNDRQSDKSCGAGCVWGKKSEAGYQQEGQKLNAIYSKYVDHVVIDKVFGNGLVAFSFFSYCGSILGSSHGSIDDAKEYGEIYECKINEVNND